MADGQSEAPAEDNHPVLVASSAEVEKHPPPEAPEEAPAETKPAKKVVTETQVSKSEPKEIEKEAKVKVEKEKEKENVEIEATLWPTGLARRHPSLRCQCWPCRASSPLQGLRASLQ